jgi:hypothetical protein
MVWGNETVAKRLQLFARRFPILVLVASEREEID